MSARGPLAYLDAWLSEIAFTGTDASEWLQPSTLMDAQVDLPCYTMDYRALASISPFYIPQEYYAHSLLSSFPTSPPSIKYLYAKSSNFEIKVEQTDAYSATSDREAAVQMNQEILQPDCIAPSCIYLKPIVKSSTPSTYCHTAASRSVYSATIVEPIPLDKMTFGPHVPQYEYKYGNKSSNLNYKSRPPVLFKLDGAAGSKEVGILWSDAVIGKTKLLKGHDDFALKDIKSTCVYVRILWKGYPPFSKAISIKVNQKRNPLRVSISKGALAKRVAKVVTQFVESMNSRIFDEEHDERWAVGPGKITAEDLILVALHQVSKSSLQIHLRLKREL